jgi:hypothetical protein
MRKFFEFMEGYHLISSRWMISEQLIENKKSLMKEECVISCGLTQMVSKHNSPIPNNL